MVAVRNPRRTPARHRDPLAGVSPVRVAAAVRFLSEQFGNPLVPQAGSPQEFRLKFPAIEESMRQCRLVHAAAQRYGVEDVRTLAATGRAMRMVGTALEQCALGGDTVEGLEMSYGG